jgi:glycosyltransferase involved in cell wall biosynthesis
LKEATSLQENGYYVYAIGVTSENLPLHEFIGGIETFRIKVREVPKLLKGFIGFYMFLQAISLSSRISKIVKAKGADVFHVHDLRMLVVAYLLRRRFSCKIVYDSHELWSGTKEIGRFSVDSWAQPFLEKSLISCTGVVLTVGDMIADRIKDSYKVARPTVLYNAPKITTFGRNNLIRETLGLPENTKIILHTGNMSPDRGLDKAVKALSILDEKFHLVCMGTDCSCFDRLMSLAKSLGVSGRLHHLLPVPHSEVSKWASSADVGLLTIENNCENKYLCMPNKLFEYMFAGLPIISTDLPELRRVIREYNIGEVIPPSYVDLVFAILKVSEIPRKTYQEGLSRAINYFKWEEQEKKLLEAYNKL